jgi:hypothetical protein
MYPTVCTLMGLWDLVGAKGVGHCDNTEEVSNLVGTPREVLVEMLRRKDTWRDLTTLVQVMPDYDLFPVRAQYPESETATIGLNYVSAREPLWLTLADVLVSKILTARTPKALSALRFKAMEKQEDLRPIAVAGRRIDPRHRAMRRLTREHEYSRRCRQI